MNLEGRRLGPVVLRAPLGQGGFAPVWLADEAFGKKKLRDVAVKLFFLPDALAEGSSEAEAWYDTIGEEAHALCRVDHPAVVRLYSIQRDDLLNVVGLVMEYISGPNLETLLLTYGRLAEHDVVEVGASIAWALSAVHSAGLVHRDVKPSNIIRGPTGYRLIDFGIFAPIVATDKSHSMEADQTPTVAPLAGTPGYIAPECFQGNIVAKPAHDVYALGATLFRLLTGLAPPAVSKDLSPPSAFVRAAGINATSALLELIDQMLSPDPLARPRHAESVARQLEHLVPARATKAPDAHLVGMTAALPTQLVDTSLDLSPVRPWPLVGRGNALSVIARGKEGVASGTMHMLLLTGPMGMGRSRLMSHTIDQMRTMSWRVLFARCAPERRGPLRPLLDALLALPNREAVELGAVIDAAERAMPMVVHDERDGSMAGMFDSAAHILDVGALEEFEQALLDASESAPLLLALDDLQWADASTLALLARLSARAGERGRLFVLGTVRDEPYPEPALAALLSRASLSVRPQHQRLRLRPLSEDDAVQVLRSAGPCSNELAAVVAHGAGGVPALMIHALSALREFGMIQWRDGAFHAVDDRAFGHQIPGVPELLAAQLDAYFPARTDDLARRILACVALHGGGLDRALLALALGVRAEMDDTIEVLANTGILVFLRDQREVGFAQEMVRQAALNLTRQRAWFDDMHRVLLDTIAAQKGKSADAAFLAAGYERLGDERNARLWFKRGIRAAASAGLFAEAMVLGDRLAAVTSAPRARQRIGLDGVRFAIVGRFFDEARRRLDKLPSRSTLSSSLDIERRICHLEIARGIGQEGVEDRALVADADGLGDPVLRCEARIAVAGVSPTEEGMRLAAGAVELASSRERGLEFAARVRRLEINRGGNRPDATLANEDLRRALVIATAVGSAFQRIHVEGDLAIIESDLGQTAEAISRLSRLAADAQSRRMLGQERLLLQNLSALLMREGRNEEAAETSQRAAKLAKDAGDLGLSARALSVRADALWRTGKLAEALACADEAVTLQEQIRDPRRALTLLRRAEIRESMGDPLNAMADAQNAQAVADAADMLDLAWSARLWRLLRRARAGDVSEEHVRIVVSDAERVPVRRGPMTIRLLEELLAWLKNRWIKGS